MHSCWKRLLYTLSFFLLPMLAGAQGIGTPFSQPPVDYHTFSWKYLQGPQFTIYYYGQNAELARVLAKEAEKALEEVQTLYDYRVADRISYYLFTSPLHLQQSNLGYWEEDENVGGFTYLGEWQAKLVVERKDLLVRKLRKVTAQLVLQEMLYGGALQDRLQNNLLINLPNWYTEGLALYFAEGWTIKKDNRLRDGILTGRFDKFSRLNEDEQVLVSQSIWNYVASRYGADEIANVLFFMRLNKNMDAGFTFNFGKKFSGIYDDWLEATKELYLDFPEPDLPEPTQPLPRELQRKDVMAMKAGPEPLIAFAVQGVRRQQVWVWNRETDELQKVLSTPVTEQDEVSNPNLAWHPAEAELAVTYASVKGLELAIFDLSQQRPREILTQELPLHQVYGLTMLDDYDFVISGIEATEVNLYRYQAYQNRLSVLPVEVGDEIQPVAGPLGEVVYFGSNAYTDTALTEEDLQSFSLYRYNLLEGDSAEPLTIALPVTEHTQPLVLADGQVLYLTNESGITNRNLLQPQEDDLPLTNRPRSIRFHDYHPEQPFVFDLWKLGQEWMLTATPANGAPLSPIEDERPVTNYREVLLEEMELALEQAQDEVPDTSILETEEDEYWFQSRYLYREEAVEEFLEEQDSLSAFQDRETVLKGPFDYDVTFLPSNLRVQINNTIFYSDYATFTERSSFYYDRPWDVLLLYSLADRFNNYRLTGGFRLAADLRGTDLFLSLANLRGRLNTSIDYWRRSQRISTLDDEVREMTNEVRLKFTYPLSRFSSVRLAPFGRVDRTVWPSLSRDLLEQPTTQRVWGAVKGEFLFDNALEDNYAHYAGTRLSLFGLAFQRLDEGGTMGILGMDLRHYTPVWRGMVWANRLAGETSFGRYKTLYFLGGLENWLYPQFNLETQLYPEADYMFKSMGQLRGFPMNVRNGSSYSVLNSELRVPIFRMLSKRPIRNEFLDHFQAVLFADVGSAWVGASPYDEANGIYRYTIDQPPFLVTVKSLKSPWVGGFGAGFRTILLGYYVKVDYAFGMADYQVVNRQFYISLGVGF